MDLLRNFTGLLFLSSNFWLGETVLSFVCEDSYEATLKKFLEDARRVADFGAGDEAAVDTTAFMLAVVILEGRVTLFTVTTFLTAF